MIERIADKSTYGAIDPVFLAPPSRSQTEPFDSALSRAASTSRTHARLEPRLDDRDRTRGGTDAAERRENRSEAASTASSSSNSAESSTANSQSDAQQQDVYQPADSTSANPPIDDETSRASEEVVAQSEVKDQVGSEQEEATEEELAAAAEAVANAEAAAIAVQTDIQAPAEPTDAAKDAALVDGEQARDETFEAVEGTNQKATQPNPLPEQQVAASADAAAVDASEQNSTGEQAQALASEAAALHAAGTPDGKATAAGKKTARAHEEQSEIAATANAPATAPVSAEESTLHAVPVQSTASGAERQTRSGTRSGTPRSKRATPAASASAALVQAASTSTAGAESSTAAATSDTTSQTSGTPQAAAPNTDVAAVANPAPREGSPGGNTGDPRTQAARFGNGRGNAAARAGNGANGEAEVQRVRLVQRVARAFQTIGESGGEVRLRLSPPSLGSIKLEVTLQNGIMAARIETETAAARTMLVENLPALRERLATHDIKVAQFDVEVSADSRQQQQSPQQDGAPRADDRRDVPRRPAVEQRKHRAGAGAATAVEKCPGRFDLNTTKPADETGSPFAVRKSAAINHSESRSCPLRPPSESKDAPVNKTARISRCAISTWASSSSSWSRNCRTRIRSIRWRTARS